MSKRIPIESDLPEGWAFASLGDGLVQDVRTGFACGEHNREGDGIAHIRPMNVTPEGEMDFSDVKFVPVDRVDCDERWLQKGDVVFNNTNSPELVGKTALYSDDQPRAFSNHMTRIRSRSDALDSAFCARFLQHLWETGYFAAVCTHHVSQASVGRSVLLATEIALPPVAEQRRIVSAIRQLSSRVQDVGRMLGNAACLLAAFRQAILASACSGRLTEQWTGHQRSNSVDALLHQIASEHETGSPRGALEKSIPEGWRRVTLGFLTQSTLRSKPYITSGSRGWAKYTSTRGHYFIRSENINTDYLRLSDAVRVEPPSSSETQRTEVRPGDLLLTITGNNVGRTAVVPSDCPRAFVSQHVAIIRLHERIVPEYVWIWMRSRKHGFAQLEESSYGETKPGLNLEQLKSVWVDLPPVAEQREIVRRVEALFQLADGIERCVSAARLRADGLRQAILTRAFRGELVPTEADLARTEGRDYETADQLLARVREEAKNSPAPTRKKGRPAMQKRKLDRPTVEEAVRSMPRDRFEFDELLAEFPADYEPLKEILFKLLDDSASGLTQVFDEESRAMQFERRGK